MMEAGAQQNLGLSSFSSLRSSPRPKGDASSSSPSPSSPPSSEKKKPPFRLVQDDTKPVLRDPILRSDPIETEEAVLRLQPWRKIKEIPF